MADLFGTDNCVPLSAERAHPCRRPSALNPVAGAPLPRRPRPKALKPLDSAGSVTQSAARATPNAARRCHLAQSVLTAPPPGIASFSTFPEIAPACPGIAASQSVAPPAASAPPRPASTRAPPPTIRGTALPRFFQTSSGSPPGCSRSIGPCGKPPPREQRVSAPVMPR